MPEMRHDSRAIRAEEPSRAARRSAGVLVAAVAAALATAPMQRAASAQETVPAIADSPTAQTLFDDAVSQAAGNPAEAARLVRRLLDEYRGQVLRVARDPDERFSSVADEAERLLLANPEVLARFRAAEGRAAERMLESEGARATAASRRLTRAGLVASLSLAERALLRDAPDEARAILLRVASHPDLAGRERVAFEAFGAMAARRVGDIAAADAAQRRLEGLRDGAAPELVAEIDRARAQIERTAPRTAGVTARSPLVAGGVAEVPSSDWREIWSVELDATLFRRIFDGAASAVGARTIERARQDANWMTAVPTVLGRTVYLCEGQRVRAVDVDSRDERWSRPLGGVGVERDVGGAVDLSAIAVDEGALVVFGGHAFPNARSGPARVWCLEPEDGAVRWSVDLDGHERRADFDGLYPVGAPLLLPDVVVVAARKSTQRLEQVDWIVALDRADGSVRWASTVAGAPSTRMTAARRHAGLARDGDAVVVSSPLGVTARIRADDGSIEWLRRVAVPLRETRGSTEPWEFGGPVVAGDRVIVLSPDESEVHALDGATGRLVEARPAGLGSGWEAPRYLVAATVAPSGAGDAAARRIVLGIGGDIVAYDPRDLGRRLWALSDALRAGGVARTGVENRSGVRGRVSVAGDTVLVPGVDDFLVLSLETGALRARIEDQRPANAVLLEDRIVAAGDDALRILMPSDRAESILRARLAASPDDPGAALALVELARSTGRTALALDAARAGVSAVGRGFGGEAIRRALLDQLIELASAKPDLGEELFLLAEQLADTPALRVRMALARGEFLRGTGRVAEAIRGWSALAADPVLSREFVAEEGVARSARTDVLRRVARATARDVEATAALDESAARDLAALGAAGATDARLAEFVRDRPRTAAAMEAARTIAARAEPRVGEAALQAALHDCLVPPARLDLVDALVEELARRAPNAPAADAIRRRAAELLVASGRESPLLGARTQRFPAVGTEPGAGLDLRSRLVRLTGSAFLSRDPSMVLAVGDGALMRLEARQQAGGGEGAGEDGAGGALEPMWRLRLDDRDPTVLHAGERIVLWQSLPGVTESAMVIDPASGVVELSTPRTAELWAVGEGGAERPGAVTNPDGGAFVSAQVLPLCDGETLALVRRNGDLARFAVGGPREAPRLVRGALQQVFSASLDDGVLALGGRGGQRSDPRPQAVFLDARSLEPLQSVEPVSGQEVRWARASALGELFVGTAAGIERWLTGADGAPRAELVTSSNDAAATDAPILLGARLVVLDRNDRPLLLPLFDGPIVAVEEPEPAAPDEFGPSLSLRGLLPLPQGLLIHLEHRCILLGHDGSIVGVDSTAGERNFTFVLPTRDALLQFNGLGGRQVPGAGAGTFRIDFSYLVQRLDPAKGLRLDGVSLEVRCPNQRADRALVVDGWLLLSSSQGTTAVPLPAGGG
jgi:outer membrane protein assembly factor BamB